jgi:hypothetical protein
MVTTPETADERPSITLLRARWYVEESVNQILIESTNDYCRFWYMERAVQENAGSLYYVWAAEFIMKEERLAQALPKRWSTYLQAIIARNILGLYLRFDRATSSVLPVLVL